MKPVLAVLLAALAVVSTSACSQRQPGTHHEGESIDARDVTTGAPIVTP